MFLDIFVAVIFHVLCPNTTWSLKTQEVLEWHAVHSFTGMTVAALALQLKQWNWKKIVFPRVNLASSHWGCSEGQLQSWSLTASLLCHAMLVALNVRTGASSAPHLHSISYYTLYEYFKNEFYFCLCICSFLCKGCFTSIDISTVNWDLILDTLWRYRWSWIGHVWVFHCTGHCSFSFQIKSN